MLLSRIKLSMEADFVNALFGFTKSIARELDVPILSRSTGGSLSVHLI